MRDRSGNPFVSAAADTKDYFVSSLSLVWNGWPDPEGHAHKKTLAFIKKLRSNLFRLSSYLWTFFVPQNDKLYVYSTRYITSYQYIGRDILISIRHHQDLNLILKLKRFLLLLVLREKRFLIRLNLSLASHWRRLLLLWFD